DHQARVSLREVPGLPAAWREGLPAGTYTLRLEGSRRNRTTFVVETAERRASVLRPLEEFAPLVGGCSDPLYLQIAVEHLLDQAPQPYLGDALALLDEAPPAARTRHLTWQHQELLWQLGAGPRPPSLHPADEPTGVPAIDRVREALARGRWDRA